MESANQLEQKYSICLLKQDEKSRDTFMINVGDLPPFKECIITISYVIELDLIRGSILRSVIPTSIAPRYSPKKSRAILSANMTSKYVLPVPYTIEFRYCIKKLNELNQQQFVAQLHSPSHHIDIDDSREDAYIVMFTQKNTYLDRDIIFGFKVIRQTGKYICCCWI